MARKFAAAESVFKQHWDRYFVKETPEGIKYYLIRNFGEGLSGDLEMATIAWGLFEHDRSNLSVKENNLVEKSQERLRNGYNELTSKGFSAYARLHHFKHPISVPFEFDPLMAASFREKLMAV